MSVDYIITNSITEERYFDGPVPNERFPSFVSFHSNLRELEPVQVFDPAEWSVKRPTIYVYRTRKPSLPGR